MSFDYEKAIRDAFPDGPGMGKLLVSRPPRGWEKWEVKLVTCCGKFRIEAGAGKTRGQAFRDLYERLRRVAKALLSEEYDFHG